MKTKSIDPKKPASKREEILKEALKIAESEGVKGLNANQIAKRMDCPPSLVFYYFKTQEDLYLACLEKSVTENQARVADLCQKVTTPKERLLAYLKGNLEWALASPGSVSLILIALAQSTQYPRFAKAAHQALSLGCARVAALIAEVGFNTPHDSSARWLHRQLIGEVILLSSLRHETKKNRNLAIQSAFTHFESLIKSLGGRA